MDLIKYSIIDYDNKNKFSRKLKYDFPWNEPFSESSIINSRCHHGQRKLLYSEIEFFTYVSKYIILSECLIVYIGSAPGTHQIVLMPLFSNCSFLFYDPRKFDFEEKQNIIIKTGKDGFFSSDKIPEVLKIANGRKIIYISDIRREASNEIVYEDAIWQQEWGILMNAEFMQLKMRFPFSICNKEGICDKPNPIINDYDINKIKNRIIIMNKKKEHHMLYLFGNIYTQIYPSQSSAETRLYVQKNKYLTEKFKRKYNLLKKDDENYLTIYYDTLKYEGKCNFFNNHVRNKKTIYKKSNKLKEYIIGYDDSYDKASEYYIIEQYFKYFIKINPSFENILDKIFEIHYGISKLSGMNLVLCSVSTTLSNKIFIKKLNLYSENTPDNYNNDIELKKKKDKLSKYIVLLKENIKMIQYSFNKQAEFITYNKEKQLELNNDKKIQYGDKIICHINNNIFIFNEHNFDLIFNVDNILKKNKQTFFKMLNDE
jgi:hypothetical protein